jgi:hypothetical protein
MINIYSNTQNSIELKQIYPNLIKLQFLKGEYFETFEYIQILTIFKV